MKAKKTGGLLSSFEDLRIVDNFYQTSAFFPMPTILIATLNEDGTTNLGAYSLCFPYYIAGKSYYAMILECRNSSHTAQNLLRTGHCALNFLEDSKKDFAETVKLGFPGEESKDKMKHCPFHFEKGQAEGPNRPQVLEKAYQVFECTWDDQLEKAYEDKKKIGQLEGVAGPYHDFNGITSKFGCHFILKIDKILMKKKHKDTIIDGVKAKNFPKVPVDYSYRDSMYFWYERFCRPIKNPIPAGKEADIQSVMYGANPMDDKVKFTKDACQMLVKVPRIFLKACLQGCVDWAKENKVTLITPAEMKIINDKRAKEKKDR
jgi:flavin reductase (DIM6/NTAB) family NADH-FMN oxidoreductase RutF